MPDIAWSDVLSQISTFSHTSIIAGYVPYILGIGIGAWAVRVIVKMFLGG